MTVRHMGDRHRRVNIIVDRPSNRHNAQSPNAPGRDSNARRNYDRYNALARDARLAGNITEIENC
jgi:hypothetical protein